MFLRTKLQQTVALAWFMAIGAQGAAGQATLPDSQIVVFSVCAGSVNPPAQTVSIPNQAAAAFNLQITHPTLQPAWLSVSQATANAATTVTLAANIAGLPPGRYPATVEVTSSHLANPIQLIVILVIVPCTPGQGQGTPAQVVSAYLVELRFTGYTGLITSADCQVDPRGFDVLDGILIGAEPPAQDEDVKYTGAVFRRTAIDFCDSKGRRGVGDDERRLCSAKLTGAAIADVELTVYGEQGRGAYLESTSWPTPVIKRATGDCDPPEMAQILADYPTAPEGGAGSPNGQPIDDPQSLLFANGLARLRVGYWPSQSPQGGWTLRVLQKLR